MHIDILFSWLCLFAQHCRIFTYISNLILELLIFDMSYTVFPIPAALALLDAQIIVMKIVNIDLEFLLYKIFTLTIDCIGNV